MDPAKVEAILNIKTPKERAEEKGGRYTPSLRKQVKSFLGAAGFYRRFIKDFATLTACLTDLTKDGKRREWTDEHTKAWRQLQQRLASQPVLRQPDMDRPFYIDTDASNVGIGAVLIQKDEENCPHPIAYASRKMSPAEVLYSTREQEALAILFGIEKFSDFVKGRKFTVITDHRSLSWLLKVPILKGRLLNWAYKLRSYDFEIVYRRGAENQMADLLSRAHFVQAPSPQQRHMSQVAQVLAHLVNTKVEFARLPIHDTEVRHPVRTNPEGGSMPQIFQAHPCILTNRESDNKELPQEPPTKRKRGKPRKDQQRAPKVTIPSQNVGQEARAKRYCTRSATNAQPEKAAEPSMEEHESHEERKAEAPDSKQEPAEAKAEVKHE